MTTAYSLSRSVAPASEPLTTAEAKKHLEIASGDTTHDTFVDSLVASAREQVEHDTGRALIDQTWLLKLTTFPVGPISVPLTPLQSISSLTYYDASNQQQTLATSVYGLDVPRRIIYLKYDQEWPAITEQHDGIVATIVAGYGSSGSDVPNLLRQAMLLQVGKWFLDRDMTESNMTRYTYDAAYDRLIRRAMRSNYP